MFARIPDTPNREGRDSILEPQILQCEAPKRWHIFSWRGALGRWLCGLPEVLGRSTIISAEIQSWDGLRL